MYTDITQLMERTLLRQQRRGSNEKAKPNKKDIIGLKADKKTSAASEPFSLNIRIESPPLVSYGPPEDSSGALLSGILDLIPHAASNVIDNIFEVAKLEMKLIMEVGTRRPIGHNCPACSTRSQTLHTWNLIPSNRKFPYNNGAKQGFPFSFLLPGNLPATTRSSLAIVSYKLIAEAVPPQRPVTPSSIGSARPASPKRIDSQRPVIFTWPLLLQRSILPSPEPKHSQRIFPPTTLSASITLPTVLYPGATDNAVDLTISGLKIREKLRWSLRKITWRLDELAKVVSPACAQHAGKVGGVEGKGILYEDTRVIGTGEMKSGWKHDAHEGKIEAVMYVGSVPAVMAACDVQALSGVHVSHNLVVECIVSEELLHLSMGPAKKGGIYQPTGNARVLRMTFPIIMTERGGMGISWDEEIPPRYEDVAWNVPPAFSQIAESSVDAERESLEGIEAVEGVRRPRRSLLTNGQSEDGLGPYLTRTDSESSGASL